MMATDAIPVGYCVFDRLFKLSIRLVVAIRQEHWIPAKGSGALWRYNTAWGATHKYLGFNVWACTHSVIAILLHHVAG